MAGQWEALTGKPCWAPARQLKDRDRGYILLEEECANAHMMRSFWGGRSYMRIAGRVPAMRTFIRKQPPGYREGDHKRGQFAKQCELLARAYVRCIPDSPISALDAFEWMRTYPPLFPDLEWEHVPIHILNDGSRFGIPPNLLALFQTIENIKETERFARSLASMPGEIQRGWQKVKHQLRTFVAIPGLDFKPWGRDANGVTYSVRVSKGHRAHLLRSLSEGTWLAIDIGTHQQMGHG